MSEALAEVDAVIHTAGVAQTMSGVPEDDYRLLNTEATMKLARAAERVGVRRFVFLSSIRAQSGSTAEGVPDRDLGTAADRRLWPVKARCRAGVWPRPISTGWRSASCSSTAPACRAIWRALAGCRSPYPLPLASLKAKRSLLALDNLVEAVAKVLDAPNELKRPFIVADPEPLTVGEMIMAMRQWSWPARRLVPGAEPGAESRTSGPLVMPRPTGCSPACSSPTARRSPKSIGPRAPARGPASAMLMQASKERNVA